MGVLLTAILIGLPVLDIVSLIEVGRHIGVWPTLGLLVVAFFAGSVLMRSQGFAILRQAQTTLEEGGFPAREVFDGACVLVGALLLVFPGFVSDLIGVGLLIPPVRSLLRRSIGAQIRRSGRFAVWTVGQGAPPGPGTEAGGPVIDGECRPVEETVAAGDAHQGTPDTAGSGAQAKPSRSPWATESPPRLSDRTIRDSPHRG